MRSLLVDKLLMRLFLHTPFKRYFYRYPYMFTPSQLIRLGGLALEASRVGGTFYEVGCAYGDTAIFLKKLLDEHGADVSYTVIDTFEGFLPDHVRYEVDERHVSPEIRRHFAVNDVEWVRRRFERNRVSVGVHAGDACSFDFGAAGPIAFCLLDVDLYLPIAQLLPKLYDNMLDGGVLVVDDCDETHADYNGAYHAFMEFVGGRQIPYELTLRKLGVIRRRPPGRTSGHAASRPARAAARRVSGSPLGGVRAPGAAPLDGIRGPS